MSDEVSEDRARTEGALRSAVANAAAVDPAEVAGIMGGMAPAEVAACLAERYGDVPAEALACALGAGHVPVARTPTRTVGVYYCRFGLGGVERVARDLIVLWRDMGYDVVLITDDAPAPDDQPVPPGVRRAFVPAWQGQDGADYRGRARAWASVLADSGIDLLVYHQWMGLALPWDILLAKLGGIPVVIHTHGIFSSLIGYGGARHCALAPCYAFADAVVCLSAVDGRFWRTYNGNVFVTPNPLSACVVRSAPAPLDGGTTVLWVGRFSKEKRAEEAVEAMAAVVRAVPGANLVLVGSGPADYRAFLEDRVARLGLSGHVEFAGEHGEDEMPSFYRAADVLLLTSHLEGYSLVLQEALAMGLPCVMYRMPYLMLCGDDRGLAVAPLGDVEGLASNVVRILSDGDLRRAMGAAGREHVAEIQKFDRAALWRDVFAAAVARHDAGPDACGDTGDVLDARLWGAVYDAVAAAEWEREGVRRELEEGIVWLRGQVDAAVADVTRCAGERDRLRADLDAVVGSRSYRLGRALTAPLRWLRTKIER